MNRITILLAVSVLVCAAAVGQSSRSVFTFDSGGERGWLGVSVEDVTKKLADREKLNSASGAYVSDVVEESPAEEAGIREGDVIVKFGAKEIGDSDDLIRAVRKSDPGEEVAIVVDRAGVSKTVKAKLDEMESPRSYAFTVPPMPNIAPTHPGGFGMTFHRTGERLGMDMQDLGKQLAAYFEVPGNRGVLVTSVSKKGSAAEAGMKAGDVIVRVNRNTVRDVDDLLEEIRDADADSIPFEVIRKGKTVTMTIGVVREDETSSLYYDMDDMGRRGHRAYRDAMRAHAGEIAFGKEKLHGLKESLMELKEELRENAMELKEKLCEELRSF